MQLINAQVLYYISEYDSDFYSVKVKVGKDKTSRNILKSLNNGVDVGDTLVLACNSFHKASAGEYIKIHGHFKEDDNGVFSVDCVFPEYIINSLTPNVFDLMKTSLFKSFNNEDVDKVKRLFGNDTVTVLTKKQHLLKKNGLVFKDTQLRYDWFNIKNNAIAYEFLRSLNIKETEAVDIIQQYIFEKRNLLAAISANPYSLLQFEGVAFDEIDKYAIKVGWVSEHPSRITNLIKIITESSINNGSTCVPIHEVKAELKKFNINITKNELLMLCPSSVTACDKNQYLICDNKSDIELDTAKLIVDYLHSYEVQDLSFLEPDEDYLNKNQRDAVKKSLKNKVSIITGGPGVGKTTVVKSLINTIRKSNPKLNIVCAAPTGKASVRMEESTNEECTTIHYLMGSSHEEGLLNDRVAKINADYLIIDEFSMVDIYSTRKLIRLLNPKTRLIIIGDKDQLASVEAGNVLSDLIDSGLVGVSILSEPVRVDSESGINKAAKIINKGELPTLSQNRHGDIHLIETECDKEIVSYIDKLLAGVLKNIFKQELDNVQILSSIYETSTGVDNINEISRKIFNPNGKKFNVYGKVYYTGDRVMQQKRDKKLGLINGSVGVIKSFQYGNTKNVTINFDGRDVEVPFSKMNNLKISFCSSIHKSQGSEYDTVIIPLHSQSSSQLNRKQIYTAITRAKKHVFLIGDKKCLEDAIKNTHVKPRHSRLKSLLIEHSKLSLTNKKRNLNEII